MAEKRTKQEIEAYDSDDESSDEPRQRVVRDLSDEPDVGPYYPSGMSAPEAATAGAVIPDAENLEAMGDTRLAALRGEDTSKDDE